ncbi:hypothetical protein GJ744_003163 [Endocarpon pusillum]|uniref:DnaJ homologue subfamily C member 28 conserved domain-containing protein n=1 Tax=Endocarpon pusillum TaxID=364733 RepID=A0A8H7E839_9EURO|nr:hypothetical protein GJ744_003163 [Endocarpon pusillum]
MRARFVWTYSSFAQIRRLPVALIRCPAVALRTFTNAPPLASAHAATTADRQDEHNAREKDMEEGAMSRRLAEMTEDSIASGGSSAAKNVEAAGFSEELKKQLESRITDSAFRNQNQRAFAEAEMPSSAGKGTRDQATAQPWTGTESLHDSALRMLDDSHKRLRGIRAPRVPQPTNLRPRPKKSTSTGERLANARDRTSIYAAALSNEMSEGERNQMRKELQERFSPGARPMPTTLQGLTSLANERIEDAIARGQFKNIPRGKGKNVERDYNASSPFLDTTEYFMNKIIQKQEIVPPWIERQQELVKSVASFRGRLRNDWKRHAARMIASKGGTLESQIRRAQAYALAEENVNPPQSKVEELSKIDSQGNLSTVAVKETPPPPVPESAQEEAPLSAAHHTITSTITITETSAEAAASSPASSPPQTPHSLTTTSETHTAPPPPPPPPPPPQPTSTSTPPPNRSSPATPSATQAGNPANAPTTTWPSHPQHLTRSYNLMAPSLAQKPYYSLTRELNRCYADVAPLLADEIRQRAQAPRVKVEEAIGQGGGVLERLGAKEGRWKGHLADRVPDEDLERKGYGFREFWRDLFGAARKAEGDSGR